MTAPPTTAQHRSDTVAHTQMSVTFPFSRSADNDVQRPGALGATQSRGESKEQSKEQSKNKMLLRALLDGPLGRAALLAAVGLRDASQNYRRNIVPLLERGLVVRTIPDKPSSKYQEYQLTDAGRQQVTSAAPEVDV
ncbi:MAG: hypothetical protein FWH11_02050 [Micrococcales bacterium]|nr:hypothetical protein [Micrococcales bacterium]